MIKFLVPISILLVSILVLVWADHLSGQNVVSEELDRESLLRARKLAKSFKIINERLTKKFPVDFGSVKDNIEAAKQMLKVIKAPTKENSSLKEALELFIALPKSLESCDYQSFKIIASNYEASKKYHANFDRFDYIVFIFGSIHARLCVPKYLNNFNEIFERAQQEDSETLYLVDKLFDQVINHMHKKLQSNVPTAGVIILDQSDMHNVVQAALDARKEADDLEDEYLFEDYVEKPCKRHMDLFKEVFAPARLNAELVEDKVRRLVDNLDNSDFTRQWINYRLCLTVTKTSLRKSRKEFASILEEMTE